MPTSLGSPRIQSRNLSPTWPMPTWPVAVTSAMQSALWVSSVHSAGSQGPRRPPINLGSVRRRLELVTRPQGVTGRHTNQRPGGAIQLGRVEGEGHQAYHDAPGSGSLGGVVTAPSFIGEAQWR
jgi:hypothetical protein